MKLNYYRDADPLCIDIDAGGQLVGIDIGRATRIAESEPPAK